MPRFDTNRSFEFDIHERFRAIYLRAAYVIPADEEEYDEHEDPTTGLVCMTTSSPVMIPMNHVGHHRPVCLAKSVNAVTQLGESNGGWGFLGLPDAPASLPSVVLLDPAHGYTRNRGGGGVSYHHGGAHGGCSVSVSDFHHPQHYAHLPRPPPPPPMIPPPPQPPYLPNQQQVDAHFSLPCEERGAECSSVPCLDLSCRTFLPARTHSGYENMTELMEQVEQYIEATSEYLFVLSLLLLYILIRF